MQCWKLAVLAAALCTSAHAAQESAEVTQLHALFARAWEQDLKDDPRAATQVGDKRFNALWADHSLQAWAQRDRDCAAVLKSLAEIPLSALPAAEQLNHELFRRLYENRRHWYGFNAHLRPLD